MKRCLALVVAYLFFLASSVWAAEEVRPLGMSSATGGYSGDIRVGNTCTTSPLGKYYCGLNARHIYFFADNTVNVDHLYPLAAGTTGFPYVSGGTWTVDAAATYRGRLGTGTPDNTTFWRGDGAWGTPPGTTTTTLPWDNITSTPTTLVGYGITDYQVPTALPWDNITRTLSAGVTDTELSYVNNVTSAIQTQLNAKQAYDADLSVLSLPTAWRLFYSNGSQQITELPFGTDNQCLQSTGQYAAPEWGSCGSGSGDYDANNVAITGGTIDNTTIGGTTPAAATFASLTRGSVSNTEFGYLDGVTSALQTQLNLKRALDNVTFSNAGVATFDNEVIATQFVSTGADNTHYFNVANTGPPNTGTETTGDCYYDNTALTLKCWDGNSWEASTGTVTPSSTDTFTNKTFDAAATGNVLKQLKYWVSTIPQYKVGTGAVYDNEYHTVFFSNSTDKAENCSVWYTTVPEDIDTDVDLSAKFKFVLVNTDTAAHNYVISMKSAANSSVEPYTYANQGNEVAMTFAGDGSGAAYDVETVGFTTLTNWKSNVTAGQFWSIFVCRDGDADASTVNSYTLSLTIRYGSTQ